MKRQNLLLTAFATILLLSSPAFAAEGDETSGSEQNAGQASPEDRGPPPGGRGHGPQLTEAQKTCLEGILGKPGQGERPSHEKMHAAMETCGVPKPSHGGRGRPPRSEDGAGESQEQ